MARAAEAAPILTVRSRADLRDWLAVHHGEKGPVWLASFKKHHPDYLAHEPQVEELLCWGWIDGTTRALDADRSRMLIAPRIRNRPLRRSTRPMSPAPWPWAR